MKRFEIGQTFCSTSIFTGGTQEYIVTKRTEREIFCNVLRHEIDGTHTGEETFEIHTDDNGDEYIVLWEYCGHHGIISASETEWHDAEEPEPEETDDYEEDYDPCFGCQAYDGGYNCKHCPHGDDGHYSVYDVYRPSELL